MERAVAYIRVSSESDEQLHSFAYQLEYWQEKIGENPNYEFKGIYADKGISGRSVSKRPQLLRLLADARENEFDIVFTKSVSRFTRNTIEGIKMIRELRDLGVRVIFEKENIDTFSPNAELSFALAVSVAQNDLEIYSQNQRGSYKRRFQNGFMYIGSRILGYSMNKNTNTLEIIPEEAKTIKRIFELYLEGNGLAKVTLALENEGYTNTKGSTKWSTGAIRYILSNEKYKGCSEAQKTVTINGIEKRNNGFSEKYYMENTHEPIISPDDFEKVQVLLRERSSSKLKGKKGHEKYPFAGKVECECCGNKFNHKINNTNKSWRTGIWLCSHQNNYGKKVCNSSRIKDNILEEKFIEAFNEFIKEKKESNSVVVLKTMLEQLVGDERTLTSYKVNHLINEEEYKKEVAEIRKEIKDCTNKLEKELRKEIKTDGLKPLESFDKKMVDDYLEKVLVGNYRVTFIFVNGVIITKTYTNGPSGNQKGWKEKQLNRLKGEFGNGNI